MHKKRLSAFAAVTLVIISAFAASRMIFPIKYENIISAYCLKYGIEKHFVFALIKAESNFDPSAVSRAGAVGVMQLTDETFDFFITKNKINAKSIYDTDSNICAGIWYISYLAERYKGNMKNAVAAYNAGASNVDKWLLDARYSDDGKTLKKIPFPETAGHIAKTARYTKIYKILYKK